MKRHGNLWQHICNMEALHEAHKSARKGKLHYSEVKWVDANLDTAIGDICHSLQSKAYTTSQYDVEERFDGKKMRTIHKLPYYPDRIVQHALVNACEPIWKASFIRDTFQSIPGRGTNDARKRVQSKLKDNPGLYALKIDVRKYYPNVTHSILKEKVRGNIKCANTLWLIDDIIDSCDGLPIGNYTSQYFGNIYLSDFDWWVKQSLCPVGYYRYCDDIVVLGLTPSDCHAYREQIFNRLTEYYNLAIKGNWQVFPVDIRGLDFVGFVFTSTGVKLRRSIAKGMVRKSKDIRAKAKYMTPYQIANGSGSYWGWCKHGQGRALWAKHMTKDVLSTIRASKTQIRKANQCK